MTTRLIPLCFSLFLVCFVQSQAQFRVTAGVKGWYATWNIPIDAEQGVEQSSYSPAFMAGPYLSIRIRDFSVTGTYSTSVAHFETTAKNPGVYVLGFNGTRIVSRQDINLFLNYSISPEVTLFFNYKRLDYTMNEALAYITGLQARTKQKFEGTGYGLGLQITVPFSGGSPLYSFMSMGAVANSFVSKDAIITFVGYGTQTIPQEDEGSEVLFFLDAGLGMRFLPSAFGGSLGIRVENAQDTKTIFGPVVNLFYTF